MKQRTQFWLALAIIGIFVLAIVFGPETAVIGAVLWFGLTVAGVVFVKVALRGMA